MPTPLETALLATNICFNGAYANPITPLWASAAAGGSIGPDIQVSTIAVNAGPVTGIILDAAGTIGAVVAAPVVFNKTTDQLESASQIVMKTNIIQAGGQSENISIVNSTEVYYDNLALGNLLVYGDTTLTNLSGEVAIIRQHGTTTDSEIVTTGLHLSSLYVSSINGLPPGGGGSSGPDILVSTVTVNPFGHIEMTASGNSGVPQFSYIQFDKTPDKTGSSVLANQVNIYPAEPLGIETLAVTDALGDYYVPFAVGNLNIFGTVSTTTTQAPPIATFKQSATTTNLEVLTTGFYTSSLLCSSINGLPPGGGSAGPNLLVSTLSVNPTGNIQFPGTGTSSITFSQSLTNTNLEIKTTGINTSTINVSSINVNSAYVSTLYVSSIIDYIIIVSTVQTKEIYTSSFSSITGAISGGLGVSTINLNPALNPSLGGVNLGLGQFAGSLVGGILSGGLNTVIGGVALGTGIVALVSQRQTGFIVPPGTLQNFQVVNTQTQLQYSTLGTATSTFTRFVSSIDGGTRTPGLEYIVSSIISPGTLCVRSFSDPLNPNNASVATSTIQSFGFWVPVPAGPPATFSTVTGDFVVQSTLTAYAGNFSTTVSAKGIVSGGTLASAGTISAGTSMTAGLNIIAGGLIQGTTLTATGSVNANTVAASYVNASSAFNGATLAITGPGSIDTLATNSISTGTVVASLISTNVISSVTANITGLNAVAGFFGVSPNITYVTASGLTAPNGSVQVATGIISSIFNNVIINNTTNTQQLLVSSINDLAYPQPPFSTVTDNFYVGKLLTASSISAPGQITTGSMTVGNNLLTNSISTNVIQASTITISSINGQQYVPGGVSPNLLLSTITVSSLGTFSTLQANNISTAIFLASTMTSGNVTTNTISTGTVFTSTLGAVKINVSTISSAIVLTSTITSGTASIDTISTGTVNVSAVNAVAGFFGVLPNVTNVTASGLTAPNGSVQVATGIISSIFNNVIINNTTSTQQLLVSSINGLVYPQSYNSTVIGNFNVTSTLTAYTVNTQGLGVASSIVCLNNITATSTIKGSTISGALIQSSGDMTAVTGTIGGVTLDTGAVEATGTIHTPGTIDGNIIVGNLINCTTLTASNAVITGGIAAANASIGGIILGPGGIENAQGITTLALNVSSINNARYPPDALLFSTVTGDFVVQSTLTTYAENISTTLNVVGAVAGGSLSTSGVLNVAGITTLASQLNATTIFASAGITCTGLQNFGNNILGSLNLIGPATFSGAVAFANSVIFTNTIDALGAVSTSGGLVVTNGLQADTLTVPIASISSITNVSTINGVVYPPLQTAIISTFSTLYASSFVSNSINSSNISTGGYLFASSINANGQLFVGNISAVGFIACGGTINTTSNITALTGSITGLTLSSATSVLAANGTIGGTILGPAGAINTNSITAAKTLYASSITANGISTVYFRGDNLTTGIISSVIIQASNITAINLKANGPLIVYDVINPAPYSLTVFGSNSIFYGGVTASSISTTLISTGSITAGIVNAPITNFNSMNTSTLSSGTGFIGTLSSSVVYSGAVAAGNVTTLDMFCQRNLLVSSINGFQFPQVSETFSSITVTNTANISSATVTGVLTLSGSNNPTLNVPSGTIAAQAVSINTTLNAVGPSVLGLINSYTPIFVNILQPGSNVGYFPSIYQPCRVRALITVPKTFGTYTAPVVGIIDIDVYWNANSAGALLANINNNSGNFQVTCPNNGSSLLPLNFSIINPTVVVFSVYVCVTITPFLPYGL